MEGYFSLCLWVGDCPCLLEVGRGTPRSAPQSLRVASKRAGLLAGRGVVAADGDADHLAIEDEFVVDETLELEL